MLVFLKPPLVSFFCLLVVLSGGLLIQAEELYFLNLASVADDRSPPSTPFINGFKAALYVADAAGASTTISLIEPTNSSAPIATIIEEALNTQPELLGIVGVLSDSILDETVRYTSQHAPTLTAFGPYTNDLSSREWSLQKYFIRTDPAGEVNALAGLLVDTLHVKRVGLFQLKGGIFSSAGYLLLQRVLFAMHAMELIEYSQPDTEEHLNQDAFKRFVEQKPQAIIIFAGTSQHCFEFVKACIEEPSLKDYPMFFTSDGYTTIETLTGMYKDEPLSFYFTSTNLFPDDTEYRHIQVFKNEMASYIDSGKSNYTSYDNLTAGISGGFAVFGWITAKSLLHTVTLSDNVVDRETYQNSLFEQQLYVVGKDNVIGTFAGDCTPYETLQKAMCNCNNGGHAVGVFKTTSSSTAPELQRVFGYPRTICNIINYTAPFYAQLIVLAYNDEPALNRTVEILHDVLMLADNTFDDDQVDSTITVVDVQSDKDLLDYVHNHLADVLTGPVENVSYIATRNLSLIIVDPIDRYPVARIEEPLVLYLMPTLDQQVYVAAEMAKQNGFSLSIILQRGIPDTNSIIRVIHNAAGVYELTVPINDFLEDEEMMELCATDVVMVIGISPRMIEIFREMLERNPNLYFLVLYEEFALYYDDFCRVFRGALKSVQDRLLTQTNLPLCSDYSPEAAEAFPVLEEYHNVVNESLVSPLTLQAWYTVGVLMQILTSQYGNVSFTLEQCIYRFNSYSYGGVLFDNLLWDPDCVKGQSDIRCQNYGASNIDVISMARVLDSSVLISFGPYDPDIVLPSAEHTNMNLLLAILIPLLALVLIVCGLMIYLCCWSRSRNNSAAPKDESKPVTLMFTDIQSSTALWAMHPEEMAEAMDAHHRIIRKQIALFHCYEVKTIGDSFMVASSDPVSIVQLAIAIQKALFEYNWNTIAFDRFYLAGEMSDAESDQGDRPLVERLSPMTPPHSRRGSYFSAPLADENGSTSHLGAPSSQARERESVLGRQSQADVRSTEISFPQDYGLMWNGLRVRAGIHTGFCEIRFDEITKGYDYYGDTVNTAARTESSAAGGQILMTQSTWDYLTEKASDAELDRILVSDAGSRTLRGVPHPVQMYQVDVFGNRVFKKSSNEDEDDEFDEMESTSEETDVSRFRSAIAEMVFKVLDGVLSPFTLKKKLAQLKPLMQQWRISTSYKAPNATDEMRCRALLLRFANRTSQVIAHREFLNQRDGSYISGGTTEQNFSMFSDRRRMASTGGVLQSVLGSSSHKQVVSGRSGVNSDVHVERSARALRSKESHRAVEYLQSGSGFFGRSLTKAQSGREREVIHQANNSTHHQSWFNRSGTGVLSGLFTPGESLVRSPVAVATPTPPTVHWRNKTELPLAVAEDSEGVPGDGEDDAVGLAVDEHQPLTVRRPASGHPHPRFVGEESSSPLSHVGGGPAAGTVTIGATAPMNDVRRFTSFPPSIASTGEAVSLSPASGLTSTEVATFPMADITASMVDDDNDDDAGRGNNVGEGGDAEGEEGTLRSMDDRQTFSVTMIQADTERNSDATEENMTLSGVLPAKALGPSKPGGSPLISSSRMAGVGRTPSPGPGFMFPARFTAGDQRVVTARAGSPHSGVQGQANADTEREDTNDRDTSDLENSQRPLSKSQKSFVSIPNPLSPTGKLMTPNPDGGLGFGTPKVSSGSSPAFSGGLGTSHPMLGGGASSAGMFSTATAPELPSGRIPVVGGGVDTSHPALGGSYTNPMLGEEEQTSRGGKP